MNTELLGMSNEELIQWWVVKAPLHEEEARRTLPIIEAYCAKHAISIGMFVERVAFLMSSGIRRRRAFRLVMVENPL